MIKENKITINNLIYALLFLVFGIILLTGINDLIGIASKMVGILLIVVGIIKSIIYIYMKGKLGNYSLNGLIIGIILILCGILLVLNSDILSFAIRTILGFWVLLAGINKIILSISIHYLDRIGFRVYFATAIIMIIVGILLITGILDKVIGILVIIYSVMEIIDYIYFKVNYKDYNVKEDTKINKNDLKKDKKGKLIEAIVEEDLSKK